MKKKEKSWKEQAKSWKEQAKDYSKQVEEYSKDVACTTKKIRAYLSKSKKRSNPASFEEITLQSLKNLLDNSVEIRKGNKMIVKEVGGIAAWLSNFQWVSKMRWWKSLRITFLLAIFSVFFSVFFGGFFSALVFRWLYP